MKLLVVGGAGFIGINTADYYLNKGEHVAVLDNFSRKGTEENIKWLQSRHKKNLEVIRADIVKDQEILDDAVSRVDVVLHFAAQVAVTTSVKNPRLDFETNVIGTFNLLEAIRKSSNKPILLYSSTNKVYGGMEDLETEEVNGHYEYKKLKKGVPESRCLDFHSPYGCSKGAADQYIRDYSRIFGLKTIVFRQSCIYGYRQFGVEDQGWVAWFTIASMFGKELTIYGNGKQARDVLFIDDLIEAYDKAIKNISRTNGQIYNIGGGPKNILSLLELIKLLEEFFGRKIKYKFSNWRPGDQPVFIADISKAKKEFGWGPRTRAKEGVFKLAKWVKENGGLFSI
jgi:CDP-paratose 2-epimerase